MSHTAEEKAKIVLEVLKEEKTLEEIASENQLNPNMIRGWRKEFLSKASTVFEEKKAQKEEKRREEERMKERQQMRDTIAQLTLERDFLQRCFREIGQKVEIPDFGKEG